MFITAIEQTVQINSISGIWSWGFGQILAMVLAVIEVLRTLNKLIEPIRFRKRLRDDSYVGLRKSPKMTLKKSLKITSNKAFCIVLGYYYTRRDIILEAYML